jgi:tRNA (cmo5U34)-methyltransferase
MSGFENTRWAEEEFSRNYREAADIFLPFRRLFMDVAKSLYGYFLAEKGEGKVLDLGCGDGLFVQELLKSFAPASVTMVDGSAQMLAAAKKRLQGEKNLEFIEASFQDLMAGKALGRDFDFIFSSLAIHHLPFHEKKDLYSCIHRLLVPGGCFVHYDVVLSPSEKIEAWYMSFWRQWIADHPDREAAMAMRHIPDEYKENKDNMPDTLASQLQILEEIGFKDVDCFCKFGIFSLFGGFR